MFSPSSLIRASLLLLPLVASSALAQDAKNTGTAKNAPVENAPVEKNFVKDTGFQYGPWHSSVLGGGGYIQNVVPCPTNPRRFYAYVDVGGVYRSDDGGQTWRMLHGNLPPGLQSTEVRGLSVDSRDDKRIILATGSQYATKGGIFVSRDAGETFEKVLTARYLGNGNTRSNGFILTRSPQKPDVLLTASVDDGVWKSSDNGQSWQESGGKGLHPSDLRFDRTDPKRLWMCASDLKIGKSEYQAGFYRSDDGGATWNKLSEVSPSETLQDPKDGGSLFGIFGGNLIRRSRDGGATWEDFSQGLKIDLKKKVSPISDSGYKSLAAGPDFILTGSTSNSTLYKLNSGATQWEKIERAAPEVGDWFHKGSYYFGAALGSITVDPNDAKHWFLTDFFAIYQTRDAGKTWRLTIDGIEVTVSHALLQDPTDAGIVHLGQADVGPATSIDGGQRLHQDKVPDEKGAVSGGKNMKCIDLCPKLPNRLYGVGDKSHLNGWKANQVYISIDRGETWNRSPMVGLPDMTKTACTTIVADLNDPYTVYITVAGPIGEGGGIYKSTDGGARWAPMNAGMPAKQWANYFFPYDIWAHGRQLAVSADGSLIAISQQQKLVYHFDPKTGEWMKSALPFKTGGRLWSVVADKLKAGRFFVGVRSDGLYRTDDSGLSWKKVYKDGISFVATDSAVPNRVAGGTLDGVVVSDDGGESWRELPKTLPYRFDNIPAFAGERLLVGSGGSGVFWIALSPTGERNIVAKPATVATLPPLKGALPALVNLSGDSEGETPPGWKLETITGTAKLLRDTKMVNKGNPASLQLDTEAATASGTLYQEWKPTLSLFKVEGLTRAKGEFSKYEVVLQLFDAKNQAMTPIVLGGWKPNQQWWESVSQTVGLPAGTARCRLALNFEGKGQIWLDEWQLSLPAPLFLQ